MISAAELIIVGLVVFIAAAAWAVLGLFIKDSKRRKTARYAAAVIFVSLGLLFNWARYQMQTDAGLHTASPQEEEYSRKQQAAYEGFAKHECGKISESECFKKWNDFQVKTPVSDWYKYINNPAPERAPK